jgi:hypothetical protein
VQFNGSVPHDALLEQLFPFWQLVISGFVVLTVVLAMRRLLRRGPSRMTRAVVLTGMAALGLVVLGFLFAIR